MSQRGFITTKPPKKRSFVSLLLPIIVLLALIIYILTMTLTYANTIMRQEAKPLDPFAINILPRFDPLSFRSLDGQTTLTGWLLRTSKDPARGTIVFVHDQGQNRLPYGLDTADLYQFFTDEGFQVVAFDLRASGNSGGDLSSFGYMETEDVLAAIAVAKRHTTSQRVLLFGLGSGTAAVLAAYDALPSRVNPDAATDSRLDELDIYRQDIYAVLLDTPAGLAADFIRAAVSSDAGFPLNIILPWSLPLGVRLSAGNKPEINLNKLATGVICPMWITRNVPDNYLDNALSERLIQERSRLYPETTRIYETPIEGHIAGYILNRDAYFADLRAFFNQWFDS